MPLPSTFDDHIAHTGKIVRTYRCINKPICKGARFSDGNIVINAYLIDLIDTLEDQKQKREELSSPKPKMGRFSDL